MCIDFPEILSWDLKCSWPSSIKQTCSLCQPYKMQFITNNYFEEWKQEYRNFGNKNTDSCWKLRFFYTPRTLSFLIFRLLLLPLSHISFLCICILFINLYNHNNFASRWVQLHVYRCVRKKWWLEKVRVSQKYFFFNFYWNIEVLL